MDSVNTAEQPRSFCETVESRSMSKISIDLQELLADRVRSVGGNFNKKSPVPIIM